ncbi:hypothetical protein M9458_006571, partial [Cirrhinus mrigala]
DFACKFLTEVDHLDYSEADIKEVFNICLDQPLSLGRWRSCGIFVFRTSFTTSSILESRKAQSHRTDCSPLPPISGSPSPLMTCKRRRTRKNSLASSATSTEPENAAAHHSRKQRRKKSSSLPKGPETVPEPAPSPKTIPKLPKLLALVAPPPLLPAMPAPPLMNTLLPPPRHSGLAACQAL